MADITGYYSQMTMPWMQLYYLLVWEQLKDVSGKAILDFGSGFGVNANHLAKGNDVTAIEPNPDMIAHSFNDNVYQQILGDLSQLRNYPDNSFDVIICHNVFEYALERTDILNEFYRLLKDDGFISIVKHNLPGSIMHKVIFENNVEQALNMLSNTSTSSSYFGDINYYENDDLIKWCPNLEISKISGIRVFYALQRNEWKNEPDWKERLFAIETMVSDNDDYKNVAMFHHIKLLKKG